MTNDMKQAIIEEASILMTGHPSKDARWFAKSVYEYFMAEQKPVAHALVRPLEPDESERRVVVKWVKHPITGPLYTAPQPVKREPLTGAQIRKWWASENGLEDCDMAKLDDFEKVVRAIEAAHGIGGQA